MPGAIVIGAGPGIGTSVAQRFAREGLPVCVLARSRRTVDAALSALGDAPVEALGLTVDVTDEAALRAALDEAVGRFGVPEVLVYNAALIQSDVLGELTARQQLDAWAINVVGAITAIAHLGPAMTEAGKGTILITGGMPEPIPEVTSLSLGKAGVRALTELLARAYEPAGVHVATVTVAGAVAPGSAFDPDDIAEEYWRLHVQSAGSWEREVLYPGRPTPVDAPGVEAAGRGGGVAPPARDLL
jgi:NAD(P)-dependent dehydrogenase (short-subunit alcohol dehydrogenase family)